MATNKYCYEFPHPSVAVDGVVFGFDGLSLNVLLIERGAERYTGEWALPGGFLREDETAEAGVVREVLEETNLKAEFVEQFGVYSDPKRDFSDNSRVISIAFLALVKNQQVEGGDDAQSAKWFPLDQIPSLAFDHEKILRDAQKALREKIHFEPIGFDLLPEEFTMTQLQNLYEAILDVKFDRRNFYKKFQTYGLLEKVGERTRAPYLYRFVPSKYNELKKKGFMLEF